MAVISQIFDSDTLARTGRLALAARRIVEGLRAGSHRSPFHGASVEFAEHKVYSPGDDLRRLDWKLFGKSDKYYVKRFEEETNLSAYILLDLSESMAFGASPRGEKTFWQRLGLRGSTPTITEAERITTKHDFAALLAACLAHLLINQGDAVGIYPLGKNTDGWLPPRSGVTHLHAAMQFLAQAQARGEGNFAAALHAFAPRVTRRSLIFLISDLLEDPEVVFETLKVLRTRRNDVVIFQVLHGDELDFPYEDISLFENPEQRDERLLTDPREIRDGYLREMQRFLDLVQRKCFEIQIDYMLLDTRVAVSTSLSRFISRRETRPLRHSS